jgi:phosphoserine phosphatase
MLEAVGHPHAVNPDRALRRLAGLRGWPVLAFSALPAARPARGS